MSTEQNCFGQAMHLVTAAWVPLVLRAAVRLGVLEIIAICGPAAQLSASEIASQIPTKNTGAPALLDRMLSLLASHSVLNCSVFGGERRYGLGPVAKYFVQNMHGAPLAPLLAHVLDKVSMDMWFELDGAILDSGATAFEKAHGSPLYEYAASDSRFGDVFYESMLNHTKLYITELLDHESCYKGFDSLKTLVDVGGAFGRAIAAIAIKYPHIKGIYFDLPAVIQRAPSHPGVENIEGDMFESVPKADAIFMKWILHNWDNEHCVKLLKNCYKALPETGKVIAVEMVVPEDVNRPTSEHVLEFDLVMMALFGTGAKERSRQEFQTLATEAGFRGISFECCVCSLWLMEFYK